MPVESFQHLRVKAALNKKGFAEFLAQTGAEINPNNLENLEDTLEVFEKQNKIAEHCIRVLKKDLTKNIKLPSAAEESIRKYYLEKTASFQNPHERNAWIDSQEKRYDRFESLQVKIKLKEELLVKLGGREGLIDKTVDLKTAQEKRHPALPDMLPDFLVRTEDQRRVREEIAKKYGVEKSKIFRDFQVYKELKSTENLLRLHSDLAELREQIFGDIDSAGEIHKLINDRVNKFFEVLQKSGPDVHDLDVKNALGYVQDLNKLRSMGAEYVSEAKSKSFESKVNDLVNKKISSDILNKIKDLKSQNITYKDINEVLDKTKKTLGGKIDNKQVIKALEDVRDGLDSDSDRAKVLLLNYIILEHK